MNNGEMRMQNWETLIAQRTEAHSDSYAPQRIEDPVERNESNYQKAYMKKYRQRPDVREKERLRESTPERKQKHREWDKSPRGKESKRLRDARFRASEKGKEAARRKSRKYFEEHKNDPIWRAHRLEIQRAWKARKKAERQKENQAA